jgi:hypothetical protein
MHTLKKHSTAFFPHHTAQEAMTKLKANTNSIQNFLFYNVQTYISNPSPPFGGDGEHAVKLEKHRNAK